MADSRISSGHLHIGTIAGHFEMQLLTVLHIRRNTE